MFVNPVYCRIASRPCLLFALVCLLLLANCQSTTSHGNSDVTNLVTLTDALRREGLTVMPVGAASQPFLSVTGVQSEVNGEAVQIFEYADNATLQQDVATIQPDGTVEGVAISWTNRPHFYQAERLLVIYDGRDETVLRVLEKILGAPFAVGAAAGAG
ncbi:MAG: hypothetical protein L0332_29420 [Chloroflexi bacterium]|nr:hypothetical protein [Chloroflexota bacterium]MCI0730822.1 hypothetical protein [Chloroflexota bacterium]